MANQVRDSYTTELVHKVCERIRYCESAVHCMKCPASVETSHGEGMPGCYMVAEQTIKTVIKGLHGPSVPLEPTKAMLEAAGEAYFSGRPRPILQVCQAVLDIINGTPATDGGNK